ncbi:flippase [Candidatus Parcubacteria bacterium]|nr:flippase [Candidatus Parcubacteria bacterium]
MNNFIRPSLCRANLVWNHAGFQKYFRNTGWMFGGRIFAMTVAFVVSIYIARYLGPSNYGLFNYVISFVGLFGFLSSLGLDGVLNREIVKDHDKKDTLIGTSFYLKLAGSVLAIITVFIVSIFTTSDTFTLILIWLFALNFIPTAFNVLEVYFNSQVLAKKVVISQITAGAISAILKLLLIYFDKGIFWLTVIYIVEATIIALLLLFNFTKIGNSIKKLKFDLKVAKSLLSDSWPLILSGVAVGIYMKIDQVMIKNMLGNEQVGLYAVAVKLSEIWYFIPGIITASVFPAIVNAYKRSEEEFNKRMSKLYFVMFWSSFLIALSTTFLAGPIVKILFGEAYLGSVAVLQIYIWSGIFVFLGVSVGKYLLTKNYIKISLLGTTLGSIINVLMNLFLIGRIGIEGAAISTFVSYSISVFIILFIYKTRNHGLLMLKSIVKLK